jgi:hypothetical protein
MPASRSLIALLVGTVAFFALWMFALKGSSSSSSSSQGAGQFQSSINKAHQAVQTSNASNAASGNDGTGAQPSTAASSGGAAASQTASSTTAHSDKASSTPSKPATHLTAKVGAHNKASLARLSTVQHAVTAHKLVAMLFYNPAAADDVAVRQELAAVSTHRGKVVKLSIPLGESANFTPVTQQVPVNFSPTLVLIAPNGQVDEIVGFSDRFEIAQRVDDGLSAK